jgi:hypothetical protein
MTEVSAKGKGFTHSPDDQSISHLVLVIPRLRTVRMTVGIPLHEIKYGGFCNGPVCVNPSFHLRSTPFAGVTLLRGVGAQAAA